MRKVHWVCKECGYKQEKGAGAQPPQCPGGHGALQEMLSQVESHRSVSDKDRPPNRRRGAIVQGGSFRPFYEVNLRNGRPW